MDGVRYLTLLGARNCWCDERRSVNYFGLMIPDAGWWNILLKNAEEVRGVHGKGCVGRSKGWLYPLIFCLYWFAQFTFVTVDGVFPVRVVCGQHCNLIMPGCFYLAARTCALCPAVFMHGSILMSQAWSLLRLAKTQLGEVCGHVRRESWGEQGILPGSGWD